jgi:hypothetical protein
MRTPRRTAGASVEVPAHHGGWAGAANVEDNMKRTLLAIALLSVVAAAGAQDDETLAPVIVERIDGYWAVNNCTPPSSAPACASFHALIRQNFTEREIGMLFGAATAYAEYRTSYDSVRERYQNLVWYVEDNGVPPLSEIGAPLSDEVEYEDTPVAYGTPERGNVVVRDDDAVILDDDQDSAVLRAHMHPDDD